MHTNADKTFVTVSNAMELSLRVIKQIAGNQVADKLHNEAVTTNTINQLVASVFRKKFGAYLNQRVQH